MGLKSFLLKLYYFPVLPKPEIDRHQKAIRDVEWAAIKEYIPNGASFLDVGCGAGYAMKRAQADFNCTTFGVDPEPGAHGVGRYDKSNMDGLNIQQSFAEKLPFEDNSFDIVYCSHVLEHVNDEEQSLREMKRVLKPGGTLLLSMPTAAMAAVNLVMELLFTSHMRFVNFFLSPFINTGKIAFINVFIPLSHSTPRAKTIFYDLGHYKVKNWAATVAKVFTIQKTILPALYPNPHYRQLFAMRQSGKRSSSVIFVCKK